MLERWRPPRNKEKNIRDGAPVTAYISLRDVDIWYKSLCYVHRIIHKHIQRYIYTYIHTYKQKNTSVARVWIHFLCDLRISRRENPFQSLSVMITVSRAATNETRSRLMRKQAGCRDPFSSNQKPLPGLYTYIYKYLTLSHRNMLLIL